MKALVEDILAGNQQSFSILVEKHERLVRQIVYRMLPNEADREDIAQDVFVKVYQNLGGFQFQSKLSTWIARIACNTCLNYLEKKRVPLLGDCIDEEATIDDWPSADPSTERYAEANDLSVRLAEEIDALPVMYGVILSLYHLQEMKYNEIADILRIPVGTVKNYLFRARKLLKNRLSAGFALEELCA